MPGIQSKAKRKLIYKTFKNGKTYKRSQKIYSQSLKLQKKIQQNKGNKKMQEKKRKKRML